VRKPAPTHILVDVGQLERAYYEQQPDPDNADQLVSFGTSGHRGSPFAGSFTEAHTGDPATIHQPLPFRACK
jgi:phosphoglucomutase